MILYLLGIEGLARLSVGDDQTAADVLTEAVELAEQIGIQEPGIFRIDADAIEALIRVGALEQAEKLLERFEARAARLGRRWAVATAGRCRAMLHLVRSEDELAVAALAGALAAHSTLGQPFELARTLLVAGTIHRRAKRRGEARVALGEAIRIFDDLAAGPWLARARAELARIDGRAPAGDGLTATEARVAELVASGLSNKAVADQLFVSVRTVETNLTRIYQKLGLSSRTQLVRRIGHGDGCRRELIPSRPELDPPPDNGSSTRPPQRLTPKCVGSADSLPTATANDTGPSHIKLQHGAASLNPAEAPARR